MYIETSKQNSTETLSPIQMLYAIGANINIMNPPAIVPTHTCSNFLTMRFIQS